MPYLSVIIPVFNEVRTIHELVEKVNAVPVDKEIIVVDDGSTDGTGKALRDMRLHNLTVIHHLRNKGKGSAFRTGLEQAKGEYVILQDGDLEYDPMDYLKLLEEIKKGSADLVLGCRFSKGYHGLLIPRLGNRFLSEFLDLMFGVKLIDYTTCYKLSRTEYYRALNLASRSFTIDIEIVAKAIRKGFRITEVPVHYSPRTYAQGKKIKIGDGVKHILGIIKFRYQKI